MKRKIYSTIIVFFYTSMLVLTFVARDVHIARIPHVTAERLTRQRIESNQRVLAIPAELIENSDNVFIIGKRMINNELRDIAIPVDIQVGANNGDYYEVTNGLFGNELVIINSDKTLINGGEVYIIR